MFEFLNERLINSATDEYSGRPKFESIAPKTFRVYRYGTFNVGNIIDGTIYKTKSSLPVKPSIEITVPTSIIPTTDGEIKNIRLSVDLRRAGSVNSEYSTYNSRVKAKPMVVNLEITKSDTAAGIAAAFVKGLENQDFLYDNLRINVKLKTTGSTTIVLSGEDEFQYFENVTIQQLINWNVAALGTYYPIEPQWKTIVKYDTDTKVDGKEGFGTYWTMLKNVQIQNSNRTDVFSQDNDDSRLLKGARYTQYLLKYRVTSDVTGMGGVGQEVVKITTHIMWVNEDIVSDLETVLQESGVIINDIDVDVTGLTVSPATVSVAVGATSDLTITTTPVGGMWFSESLDPKIATITNKTIKGIAAGKTQVVITSEDEHVKTVEVTVTAS